MKKFWIVAVLAVVSVPLLMAAIVNDTQYFTGDVIFEHQINTTRGLKVGTTGMAIDASGNITQPGTQAITGALTMPATDVELTSPVTTFSAAGLSSVRLSSDANFTGALITGGVPGQVLFILSAAGENTIRFDDSGTSMALGGNLTLTEGHGDVLGLVCTSPDGDEWSRIFDGTGN